MRTITPTGFGKSGNPPKQLGSTEAVIGQLSKGDYLLLRARDLAKARLTAASRGLPPADISYVICSAGPNALYEMPKGATVGVAKDAFAGMHSAMYEEMQSILASGRFAKVIWA